MLDRTDARVIERAVRMLSDKIDRENLTSFECAVLRSAEQALERALKPLRAAHS